MTVEQAHTLLRDPLYFTDSEDEREYVHLRPMSVADYHALLALLEGMRHTAESYHDAQALIAMFVQHHEFGLPATIGMLHRADKIMSDIPLPPLPTPTGDDA